jgi:ribosomal protein L7/L12
MVRIKLNSSISLSTLKCVENQLLMFSGAHRMLMISNIRVEDTEEVYGRRMNKTRQVQYLYCILYGWNEKGEFVGTYDHEVTERYLETYDFLHMRKNYLEFKKQWTAMHAKCTALNNPLQTLENPVQELDDDIKLEIARCIQQDKPLLAVKIYKGATGKSLEEAKEYVQSLTI